MSGEVFQQNLDHEKDSRPGGPFIIQMLFKEWVEMPDQEQMLTVQEQAGFQMFMARMDDELLRLWNAPCNTPYLKK